MRTEEGVIGVPVLHSPGVMRFWGEPVSTTYRLTLQCADRTRAFVVDAPRESAAGMVVALFCREQGIRLLPDGAALMTEVEVIDLRAWCDAIASQHADRLARVIRRNSGRPALPGGAE